MKGMETDTLLRDYWEGERDERFISSWKSFKGMCKMPWSMEGKPEMCIIFKRVWSVLRAQAKNKEGNKSIKKTQDILQTSEKDPVDSRCGCVNVQTLPSKQLIPSEETSLLPWLLLGRSKYGDVDLKHKLWSLVVMEELHPGSVSYQQSLLI